MPSKKGAVGPAAPNSVPVRQPITLSQFLKVAQLASSGGEAKVLITDGAVKVNGAVEYRRGHKMSDGDVVEVSGLAAQVEVIPAASAGTGQQSPYASGR